MPDLKSELAKVINSWDTPTPTPVKNMQTSTPTLVPAPVRTHTEFGRPITNNATRITFNFVRDNPGVTRPGAIAELTKRGVKVSSSTSLITVMLARGNLRLSNGGLFATQSEYSPLPAPKPQPKAKPAPVAKPAVVETPVAAPVQPVAPTYATPAEWTVASVVDSLNVRQAMAVYDELRKIFGG